MHSHIFRIQTKYEDKFYNLKYEEDINRDWENGFQVIQVNFLSTLIHPYVLADML